MAYRPHERDLPGELVREPHVVRIEERQIIAFCRPDAGVARRRRTGIAFVANTTDLCTETPQRAGKIVGRAVIHDQHLERPVACREVLIDNARYCAPDEMCPIPNRDDDIDAWHGDCVISSAQALAAVQPVNKGRPHLNLEPWRR